MASMRAAGSRNPHPRSARGAPSACIARVARSPRGLAPAGRSIATALGLASALLALALAPAALHAAPAWVKGEVRLNLRTGPSNEYRIIGGVQTGDRVEVLELGNEWTRVRVEDKEGWIPGGYLQDTPTSDVLLEEAQARAAALKSELDELTSKTSKLEQENASLGERDGTQRSEIETLTRENLELKAGARWPEWITGAAILTAGMVMGWILHVTAGRRQRPRIRL
jgi:SH3 domain protein